MKENVLQQAEKINKEHTKKRRWHKVVSALACIVVFCTTYALIIPAITAGRDDMALCGCVEHTHTDACYRPIETGGELTCGKAEHTHGDACYQEVTTYTCGQEESEEHIHTDECVSREQVLVCQEEEHTHSDACHAEVVTERVLSCDKAEHTHSDICFDAPTSADEGYYCGHYAHSHTDECYFEDGRLRCTRQEHTHTLACKSNPSADVETAEDWEATFANVKLSGNWAKDVLAIAATQEGYSESTDNFIVDDKGNVKGYTRYGDRYGNAYGDWCAMFCSFCIDYAGVKDYPLDANCENWIKALGPDTVDPDKMVYYHEAGTYTPQPGDLIFFDWDAKELTAEEIVAQQAADTAADADGVELTAQEMELRAVEKAQDIVDHVGLVVKLIPATEETPAQIQTIEGNNGNTVAYHTYDQDDVQVIGYGELPENPKPIRQKLLLAAAPMETAIGNGSDFTTTNVSGKSVYLTADITVSNTVNITKDTVLDLNGHKLTVTGNPLFNVTGGTLTIRDTGTRSVTEETVSGTNYGNTATYNNGTLTYYVTETEVTNADTGATTETLKKYTVTSGGMIVGANENGRAITVTGNGKVNLESGYICNFKRTDNNSGGAVWANDGGTINLSGTVIAANSAPNGGGVYVGTNATLNMTGGVISGNRSNGGAGAGDATGTGGAGVFVNSGTVNMSGGYVTNNKTARGGYFDGGGGFLLQNATLNLSGGYITGNQANGGGGIKTWRGQSGKIYMTGGYITANNSTGAEGGGVNLDSNGFISISAGHITNNIAGGGIGDGSFQHWGGGGLFCCDGNAVIYIENAMITDNEAGGYGGGVAGCSTGRIRLNVTPGGAIYDNTAAGTQMSGDASAKNDDRIYAYGDPVFNENGYQDYFCALSSTIYGGMLGGDPANWTGSADGAAVTSNNSEDVLKAAYIMGLTSNPTDAAKEKAIEKATVYINGNVSPTHGGGILCNGYLSIGAQKIPSYARLELQAQKKLLDTTGKPMELGDRVYTFVVEDAYGNEVALGRNDANGNITFDRRLPFYEAGTYTYKVYESVETESTGVLLDTSQYEMVVTVTADQATIAGDIVSTKCWFANVKITELNSGTVVFNKDPGDNETHAVIVDPTGGEAFTNQESPNNISVQVKKTWAEGTSGRTPVTVTLLQDGQPYGATVTLSESNNWTYTWSNLAKGHVYTVSEATVSGYFPSYTYVYQNQTGQGQTVTNEAFLYQRSGGELVRATSIQVGQEYLIGNADGTKVLRVTDAHANAGFSSDDVVNVTDVNNISNRCRFTAQSVTNNNNQRLILKNNRIENCWLLVQDSGGNYLKGTSGDAYSSGFRLTDGHLMGQTEWGTGGAWRYVIWDGSKFNTADHITEETTQSIVATNIIATVTNTPIANVDFSLNLKKVDANNRQRVLPGAEFELRNQNGPLHFTYDRDTGRYTYTTDNSAGTTLVTANNGYIYADKIPGGTYTLVETKAPDGFSVAGPETVTLNESTPGRTLSITVEDPEYVYELPESGGAGTTLYTFCGLLLMAAPVMYGCAQRRKRERRGD